MRPVVLERNSDGNVGIIKKLHQNEPDLLLSLRPAGDMRSGSDQRRVLLLHMLKEPDRLYSLHQVHSHRVYRTGPDITSETDGDGLVAGHPEHVLAVSVADCMPIFLFHAVSGHFAVVHSGWKGTGIVLQALDMLTAQTGIQAADFTAVLGPSIRSCCYKVDEERAARFSAAWGAESVVWRPLGGSGAYGSGADRSRGRAPYLDLLQANSSSLQGAGVQDLRYVDECTACTPDLGSFRREGPQHFTHMLAMIGYFK